jgi:hypothetical protein
MANRVIYGQKACSIGTGSVDRCISFSCDVDLAGAGTDVFIFGQLKKLGTVYSAEIPCTATVGWYLYGTTNEGLCGLTGANVASNFITSPNTTYDIGTSFSDDGVDGGAGSGLTFTGGVVTNYTATISVGEIPTGECEFTCTGITGGSATAATIPVVAPGTLPVTRPEDVTVTVGTFALDSIMGTTFCPQSVTVNAPFAREEVQCLGQALPTRFVQFPLEASISLSVNTQSYGSPDFANIINGTRSLDTGDVTVAVGGSGGVTFSLKNASIASSSISAGLDGAETMEMTYTASIGDASDTGSGLVIS